MTNQVKIKNTKHDEEDDNVLDSESVHNERKSRLFGKALKTAGSALGAAAAIKSNVDHGSKGGTINAAQSVGNLIGNVLPMNESQKNALNKVATGTGAIVGELLYGNKQPQPAVKPTIPTPPPAPVVKPTMPIPPPAPVPQPAPVVKPTMPTPPPAPVPQPSSNFSSSSSYSSTFSSSSSFSFSKSTSFSVKTTATKITTNFTPCSSFDPQDTLDFSKKLAKELFSKNSNIDECFSQIGNDLDKNKGLLKEFWDKTSKITLNAISNWNFDMFSSTINEILGRYKTSDGGVCAEKFSRAAGGQDALKNFPILFKNMFETCTKEIKIVPKKDYLRGEEMRRENLPGDFHAKLNEESRRDNQ